MSAGSASFGSETTEQLKTELIRAAANTQRGRSASPQQQAVILEKIAALESRNPTAAPVSSGAVNGRWSLLYQGPEVVKERSKAESLEGPLLNFFRPLLGFLFRTQGITQIIDTGESSVQNIAEFKFASLIRGSLNIRGTVQPSQPPKPGAEVTRVDVAFTSFRLQLGWLAFSIPLGWAHPVGWVETTYVDSSFRVGHGDKGSVFVTAKQK